MSNYMEQRRKPLEVRFNEKIDKTSHPNGCWIWTAAKSKNGYGYFGVGNGKMKYAHRLSYEYNCGPIPKNLNVLHKCDNRVCCNPEHLRLGTHQDNMDDMHAKGRGAKPHQLSNPGSKSAFAKLTEQQVLEMRQLHKEGKYTTKELAAMYGTSCCNCNKIISRTAWRHI